MNFAYPRLHLAEEAYLIRRATRADLSEITDLVRTALAAYRGVAPRKALELYIERSTRTEERWEQGDLLVAVQYGQVLGTVTFHDDAVAAGFPAGWASFGVLAVHPDAQRSGIASLLVRHCVNRAMPVATAIGIHTGSFMLGARKLYEDMGFVRLPKYDRRASELIPMEAGEPDVDILAYQLDLGDALSG